MANIKDLIFEATKTRNNIKKHIYEVADYKMCKSEADIVLEALDKYIDYLKDQDIIC